jgi:hypothetical protein
MSIFFTMLAQRNNTICGIIPDSGFCGFEEGFVNSIQLETWSSGQDVPQHQCCSLFEI